MKFKKTSKVVKSEVKSVNFILDETGSMMTCKTATISGFNEYVKTLAADKKNKYIMTLTRFNSEKISMDYVNKPINEVEELTDKTYKPNNLTPLYDAIGQTIARVETNSNLESKNVLFVIMTDGQENASKEYKRETVFDVIKKKTSDGWTFAFLGANQDAYSEAGRIGVLQCNSMQYKSTDTRNTFARAASATAMWASKPVSSSTNFWNKKQGE
jgi:hypothetical protein